MFTLASTQTLAAVAGTSSAITCTVNGAEVSVGVPTYRVLAQSQLVIGATTIYTTPAAPITALIKTILFANTTAVDVPGVALFVNGTADANRVSGSFIIPANGWATVDQDGWRVYDSTGSLKVTGSVGAAGPAGPLGPATFLDADRGDDGDLGPQGAQGIQGITGALGPIGPAVFLDAERGDDGDLGPVGFTGPTGAGGPQGPATFLEADRGDDGDLGPQGAQGIQGVTGDAGPQGPATFLEADRGDDGDLGPQGAQGIQGLTGAVGPVGPAVFLDAERADDGDPGPQGIQGFQGLTGPTGTQGLPGVTLVAEGDLLDDYPAPQVTGYSPAQLSALLAPSTSTLQGAMTATSTRRVLANSYDAVADFGFVGDLVTTRGTTSVTGTALTDSTNPFLPTDTGKRVTIPFAGAGTGVNAAQLTTTLTYVSAGAVTLAVGATNPVSNISVNYGTDNTAAITLMVSTINAQVYPQADVFFGNYAQAVPTDPTWTGSYGWPIPAVFHKAVGLQGQRRGYTSDAGDANKIGGTRLAWWGTSSDGGTAFQAMIEMTSTDVFSLKAPFIKDLSIDCRNNDQNQALYGIKIASAHGMFISNVFIIDALAAGLWTNISSTPSGDAADTTRFLFENVCFRCLDNSAQQAPMTTPIAMTSAVALTTTPQNLTVAANTLSTSGYLWTATNLGYPVLVRYTGGGGTVTLTGCTVSIEDQVNAPASRATGNVVQATPGNSCAWYADGGTGHNSCCGEVLMWQVSHGTTWGPAGVELHNCDSIEFTQMMMNGGLATVFATAPLVNRVTKPGIRINGSATSGTLAARNNVFRSGDPGVGGINTMALLDTGALMAFPAGPSYWDLMQMGNGAPVPVSEFVTVSGTQGPARGSMDWTPNGGFRPGGISKASLANQTLTAATQAVIDGSLVVVPPQGFQVGTILEWIIPWTKTTAAGTANRVVSIHYGTAGSTADATVIATGTFVATNAIDIGVLTIRLVVTALGAGTSATALCIMSMSHNLATAVGWGASNLVATMAGFNSTLPASGPAFLTVQWLSGAAEVSNTIAPVYAVCIHPGNP